VLPYTTWPWKIAALVDSRLGATEHERIATAFTKAPSCDLDYAFSQRLQSVTTAPADLQRHGKHFGVVDTMSLQKVVNVQCEDNFARAAAMRGVMRGKTGTMAGHASKHVLAEVKVAHVKASTDNKKRRALADAEPSSSSSSLLPTLHAGTWGAGTVDDWQPTLGPLGNVSSIGDVTAETASIAAVNADTASTGTMAAFANSMLCLQADAQLAEVSPKRKKRKFNEASDVQTIQGPQQKKNQNGWWMFYKYYYRQVAVRLPAEESETFRRRAWKDAIEIWRHDVPRLASNMNSLIRNSYLRCLLLIELKCCIP
jgi:hypothetical protein